MQTGSTITDASRDHTVKIDAAGLEAGRTYYYRFNVGAVAFANRPHQDPAGRQCRPSAHRRGLLLQPGARLSSTPTPASPSAPISIWCCISAITSTSTAMASYGTARTYEPAHEILTLADYRTRHGQYKREPELQELHRQHPVVAIWDDHEFANDAWKDGAAEPPAGYRGRLGDTCRFRATGVLRVDADPRSGRQQPAPQLAQLLDRQSRRSVHARRAHRRSRPNRFPRRCNWCRRPASACSPRPAPYTDPNSAICSV